MSGQGKNGRNTSLERRENCASEKRKSRRLQQCTSVDWTALESVTGYRLASCVLAHMDEACAGSIKNIAHGV